MYPLLNSSLTYTPANGTYKAPKRPTHLGHDITPIVKPTNLKALSVLPGKVIYAAKGAGLNGTQETIVIVQHANEWSAYGHLKHDSLLVKVGQQVGEYQPLATIGYTGFTQPSGVAGTHLHIQMGKGKFSGSLGNSPTTNPLPYLLQGGPPEMSERELFNQIFICPFQRWPTDLEFTHYKNSGLVHYAWVQRYFSEQTGVTLDDGVIKQLNQDLKACQAGAGGELYRLIKV